MSNFISQFQTVNETTNTDAYFTISGQEDYIDNESNPRIQKADSNKILAKKLSRVDGTFRYLLKMDRNGKIYNPLSIYGENQATTFLDRVCRSQNKFKDVNMKAFNMYLNFLRTKNVSWLHNTEREI